jgi:competence protein ComEA
LIEAISLTKKQYSGRSFGRLFYWKTVTLGRHQISVRMVSFNQGSSLMFKKIATFITLFSAVACFAAVEVNKAGAADLDSIKGIGPAMSGKILAERKKGDFKDWTDLVDRVSGVGAGNAVKFSKEGLTVNGTAYKASAGKVPKVAGASPAK